MVSLRLLSYWCMREAAKHEKSVRDARGIGPSATLAFQNFSFFKPI